MINCPEIHLFILWQKARYKQKEILADIHSKFTILKCYEIYWSENLISSNYSRFYGTNLPSNSVKEKECGKGPCLLIILRDNNPKYELRSTSKGTEWVNINMFDSKSLYRNWTNGGHKVHGTNTTQETNHNLTLLLGKNVTDFLAENKLPTDEITVLHKDIEGAHGWKSLANLFYVLNNTTNYVIIRGKNELLNNVFTDTHRDIDLLTNDVLNTQFIINGESVFNPHRKHICININNCNYYLDLWDTKHRYFDYHWMLNMLETKVNISGYNFLNKENEFYCLLYHCLIFKGFIASDYADIIDNYIKKELELVNTSNETILLDFLKKHQYYISKVEDVSISMKIQGIFKQYVNEYGIIIRISEPAQFSEKKVYNIVLEKPDSFIKIGTSILIDNEARFLNAVSDFSYFPHIIRCEQWGNGIKLLETQRVPGSDFKHFFSITRHKRLCFVKSFISECLEILNILSKHGIIHRDFIPQNVLIEEYKNSCKVYLIDFGWAIYAQDIETSPKPANLGDGHHRVGEYSDFYTVGHFLLQNLAGFIFIRNISDILCNIHFVDYFKENKLSTAIQSAQFINSSKKPLRDYVYYLLEEYRDFLSKHPRVYVWRIRLKKYLHI